MNKKLIITLSAIVCVVAAVLILFWTLFALSSVSVQFASTTQNFLASQQEIIEAGGFRKGACVLFESKKRSISNIENHAAINPNFAYLRVQNIETVFPNKFVIHLSEREELFAVENGGQFLICDRDFRVLRTQSGFSSTQSNAMLLEGLEFENEDVKVGDFLKVEQSAMLKFFSVMLANNRSLSQQLGKFQKLKLCKNVDEFSKKQFDCLQLTTFEGRKFVIGNINFAFANKVQKMFAAESALFSQSADAEGNILDKNGQKMFVQKNSNGQFVPCKQTDENAQVFSFQLLAGCGILVDNLTLDENVDRTENDIFYALVDVNFLLA